MAYAEHFFNGHFVQKLRTEVILPLRLQFPLPSPYSVFLDSIIYFSPLLPTQLDRLPHCLSLCIQRV